jgi:hypothetical protein
VLSIAKVLEDVLSGMNVLDSDSYGLYLLCAIVIPGKSLVVEVGWEIVLEDLSHFERQDRNTSELPSQDSCKVPS